MRFRSRICDLDVDLVQRVTLVREFFFAIVDPGPRGLFRLRDVGDFIMAAREISFKRSQLFSRMVRIEDAKISVERLVAPRLAGLALERADLPLHFFDDVANSEKICVGRFEFAQRFAFLRFVFGNAGGFFKNCASIFRPRAQDHVDLSLLHHRVGSPRSAGVGEKILDVAQAAGRFVQ